VGERGDEDVTEAASSARVSSSPRDAARRPADAPPRPPEVPVFPNLVFKEFLAALLVSIGLMIWSMTVDAPLLPEANPGRTENPAKAPWYFVGLQELLVYFDPWVAGVVLPTLIILGLMVIPYIDTSRGSVGRYDLRARRLATFNFLFGFALWWVLIVIGQFLRGPNWNLFWPWQQWTAVQAAEVSLWSFPSWLGIATLAAYAAAGFLLARWRWPWLYAGLGRTRYVLAIALTLLMYGIPLKMLLRLVLGVRYVLVTPWFNI